MCATFWFYLFLVSAFARVEAQGSSYPANIPNNDGAQTRTLFVLGASYVDAGNTDKSRLVGSWSSWLPPYGISYPGKPSGRYSDGRVFADVLAGYLGIQSPIPYRDRGSPRKRWRFGMNFAYAGTGVFDTFAPFPNMTTQIDLLERVIAMEHPAGWNLSSSVALLSVAVNDYATHLARNGTQGMKGFIESVVNQMKVNVERLLRIGIQKVAVDSLPPLGCLPSATLPSSYTRCNESSNAFAAYHNELLQQAILLINGEFNNASRVVLVDIYTAFLSTLRGKQAQGTKFEEPLRPCCTTANSTIYCGRVDQQGNPLYKVCKDPSSAFFWDSVHPSEAGWSAVAASLKPTLQQL